MKYFAPNYVSLFALVSFFLIGCSKDEYHPDNSIYEEIPIEGTPLEGITINGELDVPTYYYDNQGPHKHKSQSFTAKDVGFTETFESGSKGSYAGGSVSLSPSGDWYLDDALLGSLTNDRKFGSKSVRIRNSGSLTMSFNMDNGASSILVRHAAYGSNGTSNWRLISSYDDGVTWYFVGDTITTNSTTLNTVTFEVNDTQSVRYGIYKISGGSNRINIDNIEIDVDTSGGGDSPSMDSNLTFGNPSDAASSPDNYFLSKPDFSLSYNNSNGTANWVSWHLSTAWTGTTSRCNCFKSDTTLPSTFFRATTSDYTNSGFDRGHLCPSADRNGSEDSNENTYYMTNIAPQAPDNNRRSWANLESYLRSLTLEGNEVHIISGVVGTGGTGSNGSANTISNGEINVPDSFWKVALILPNGINDIQRVTASTRVIAVLVPNDQDINTDWTQFKTTVDNIENLTGYDLLENISDTIESVLESTVATEPSV
ncbi:DNA/RNA non-specific endonuclease [Zobellia nedashkovskayae]|uniref:DNA/RNA non-specific endonuclease n=1 Tax=Zobellia nedashkovskayae TaxID=2779510 RepID=UPI00188B6B32|nr:DNA/RNA non-specific endonuclease [Zobellia nedashkovskayae]